MSSTPDASTATFDVSGEFDHVDRDAEVPVAFGGTVTPLYESHEFPFEADVSEDLLKLLLLRVTSIN